MGPILVKRIKDNIFYDSKNHWKEIDGKMYGYCEATDTVFDHIWKPVELFRTLPSQVETKMEPVKEVPIVTNQALEALECGS